MPNKVPQNKSFQQSRALKKNPHSRALTIRTATKRTPISRTGQIQPPKELEAGARSRSSKWVRRKLRLAAKSGLDFRSYCRALKIRGLASGSLYAGSSHFGSRLGVPDYWKRPYGQSIIFPSNRPQNHGFLQYPLCFPAHPSVEGKDLAEGG